VHLKASASYYIIIYLSEAQLNVLSCCAADVFCCVAILITLPDQLEQSKTNSLEKPPQTEGEN